MANPKKELNLQHFRRLIWTKNFLYFHGPVILFLGLWWMVSGNSVTWAIYSLVLGPASLIGAWILSLYQIRNGKDNRLYREWLKGREERQQALGRRKYEWNTILKAGWRLTLVKPVLNSPNRINVVLDSLLPDRELPVPVVTINGTIFLGEYFPSDDKSQVRFTTIVTDALAMNPATLEVGVDGSTIPENIITINNPFRVKQEWLGGADIRWQCEGHSDERIIYIVPSPDHQTIWNPDDGTATNFDILATGRLLGTVVGVWKSEFGQWEVPIPSIGKNDCRDKRVELRVSHSKGVKVVLPQPIVMSVNHELIG